MTLVFLEFKSNFVRRFINLLILKRKKMKKVVSMMALVAFLFAGTVNAQEAKPAQKKEAKTEKKAEKKADKPAEKKAEKKEDKKADKKEAKK